MHSFHSIPYNELLRNFCFQKLYDAILSPQDQQAYYMHLLEVATNYDQWSDAAKMLDQLQGNENTMIK